MSSIIRRDDEEWIEWHCVDCDPEFLRDDEPLSPARDYDRPFVMLVPRGDPVPVNCPRCGSHSTMTQGASGLRVTNTPAERWIADRLQKALLEPLVRTELLRLADGQPLTPEVAEQLAQAIGKTA